MRVDRPSQTAEGIAAARARESNRPEGKRLFYDPYARHFLNPRVRFIARHSLLRAFFRWRNHRALPGMFGGLVARTRFIDDQMCESLKNGVLQIVILGAGYDARAYRFAENCHGTRVFEVDHPATQKVKKHKMCEILGALPDHVTYVPVRFNSENLGEKMARSGYTPNQKTLFIWEGVTMYLTPTAVDATLTFVAGNSPTGSSIVFDYFPPSVADGTCIYREAKTLRKLVVRCGEVITFGIEPKEIEAFLIRRGFSRVRNISAAQCKRLYFRDEYETLPVSRLFHFVHAKVS